MCVVKRCVSVAAEASKSLRDRWLHEALFNKFCTLTLPLSQSPFGNYAIQHAIQTWGLPICGPILTQVTENTRRRCHSNIIFIAYIVTRRLQTISLSSPHKSSRLMLWSKCLLWFAQKKLPNCSNICRLQNIFTASLIPATGISL